MNRFSDVFDGGEGERTIKVLERIGWKGGICKGKRRAREVGVKSGDSKVLRAQMIPGDESSLPC